MAEAKDEINDLGEGIANVIIAGEEVQGARQRRPGKRKCTTRCGHGCNCCRLIDENTVTRISSIDGNRHFDIDGSFDCTSQNVVYLIYCPHCEAQFVGQYSGSLKYNVVAKYQAIKPHYVGRSRFINFFKDTQEHTFRTLVLEKVEPQEKMLATRKDHWIEQLGTYPNDNGDDPLNAFRLNTRKPR